jgi:glycosyltransferase involved in cell wall biosynthesis
MNSLQLEIKLSGLTEKVFFLGKRTDIKSIYSSLDLFLLTSITEGFPNTLIESFAMEVPSVVSAVGGIPEIVSNGEHAILCKPGDINSFYNACKAILTDMELRIKLINNGKKIIQEKLSLKKDLNYLKKYIVK